MAPETAQELAVRCVVFLALDANRAKRFAAESGLSSTNLRDAAETPEFLQGVLDYFMRDESLLLAFAANCSVDPTDLSRARESLSPQPGEE